MDCCKFPSAYFLLLLTSIASSSTAAAAVIFNLEAGSVVHEFTPETIITFPSTRSQFRMAPQASDSVQFDPSGVSLGGENPTSFEILLSAPENFLFSIDPGLNSWHFSFSLDFSDGALDASFSSLTAMFLNPTLGNAPEIIIAAPGGRTGMENSIRSIPGDTLSGPFAFTGLKIAGHFTQGPSGAVTLNSASLGFYTRGLTIDADPGAALVIVPIPEPAPALLCLLSAGLLFKTRRRTAEDVEKKQSPARLLA